jgi:hypothetical protein
LYSPGFDFTRKDNEFFDAIDWVNEDENFIPNSRIIFQEIDNKSNHLYSGGHNVFYIPMLTNYSVMTSGEILNQYRKVLKYGFYDNQIFNTSVTQMDNQSLYYWLDFFCISYVMLNSTEAKDYFDSDSNFELKFNNSLMNVYYYRNFDPNSQYLHSNSTTSNWSLQTFKQSYTNYKISDVTAGDLFVMSLMNNYQWEVWANGEKIEKIDSDSDFISFQLPQSGDYDIEIKWVKCNTETYGVILSLLMVPIFIVYKKKVYPILFKERSDEGETDEQ